MLKWLKIVYESDTYLYPENKKQFVLHHHCFIKLSTYSKLHQYHKKVWLHLSDPDIHQGRYETQLELTHVLSMKIQTPYLIIIAVICLLQGCDEPPIEPQNESAAISHAAAPTCKGANRLFDHERLKGAPVCIPMQPQRVVDLSANALEALQLSGKSVVGAKPWATRILAKNYPYLRADLQSIENIGDPVDLEKIAALKPDIIFTNSFLVQGIESQLRAIAPLLIFEPSNTGAWREGYEFVSAALNIEHVIDEATAEYFERIELLKKVLIEQVGNPEDIQVSISRLWGSNSEMAMNLIHSFSSTIVKEAGLGRPASQGLSAEEARALYKSDGSVRISIERIDLIDGDILFLWSEAPDLDGDVAADKRYLELLDDPVWNSLQVAQSGKVVRAGGHWVGWGFHAAHAVLDDLFEHVAGVDPLVVSPNPMKTKSSQSEALAVFPN